MSSKVDTWYQGFGLPYGPPFLFPSSGIIDPLVLFTQPFLDHFIIYAHNSYIHFKLAIQANNTVQITIFMSHMPSHSLVGPWP